MGRGDSIGNEPGTPPEQCPPNLPELAALGRASAQAAGPADDTADAAPEAEATGNDAAVLIVTPLALPVWLSHRLPMTPVQYEFDEIDAVTAAGGPVRFPAGVHPVARRSLVFRVRLGGREVDLTRAEFDRLLRAGRIRALDPV
jgi:hypothetical protein